MTCTSRGLTLLVVLAGVTHSAGAAVVLDSAELAQGGGHLRQALLNPSYQPTTYGPWTAFPNDGRNFARVGPAGLEVLVNQSATFSSQRGNMSQNDNWSATRFRVEFRLDEPAAFTYGRSFGAAGDDLGGVTLQAEGQPAQDLPRRGSVSGTLAPGRYTFSGEIDFGSWAPGAPPMFQWGTFRDLRLSVAPEPGALGLLVVGGLAAFGRRTPRARCRSARGSSLD